MVKEKKKGEGGKSSGTLLLPQCNREKKRKQEGKVGAAVTGGREKNCKVGPRPKRKKKLKRQ